jgi:hypothetical protein
VAEGDASNLVLAVQVMVDGACGGEGLTLDGIFGSATEHAVTCFQHQRHLKADGIVGPDTWASMRDSLADFGFVNNDAWDYFQTTLYGGSQPYPFRQYGPSGVWYVNDSSGHYVQMTN